MMKPDSRVMIPRQDSSSFYDKVMEWKNRCVNKSFREGFAFGVFAGIMIGTVAMIVLSIWVKG